MPIENIDEIEQLEEENEKLFSENVRLEKELGKHIQLIYLMTEKNFQRQLTPSLKFFSRKSQNQNQ